MQIVWSVRLTSHAFRRDFYDLTSEDYRYTAVRKLLPRWAFQLVHLFAVGDWILFEACLGRLTTFSPCSYRSADPSLLPLAPPPYRPPQPSARAFPRPYSRSIPTLFGLPTLPPPAIPLRSPLHSRTQHRRPHSPRPRLGPRLHRIHHRQRNVQVPDLQALCSRFVEDGPPAEVIHHESQCSPTQHVSPLTSSGLPDQGAVQVVPPSQLRGGTAILAESGAVRGGGGGEQRGDPEWSRSGWCVRAVFRGEWCSGRSGSCLTPWLE